MMGEVVERLATGKHQRNSAWYMGFAVYGPTFLLGLLPWMVPLGVTLLAKMRGAGLRPRLKSWLADERNLLLALWFALPLVVFLSVPSRLPLYVLPLFAPAALFGGRILTQRRQPRNGAWPALALWMLLLAAARGVAAGIPSPDHDDRALAQALAGRLPAKQPATIVFFGGHPRYGLSLYLDVEVEWIEIRLARQSGGPPQYLIRPEWEESHARPAEPCFFFVATEWNPFFKEIARAAGQEPGCLGRIGPDFLYSAPRCAVDQPRGSRRGR
jgi:4-amino-4-deoxy-L-arabinose transferase